MGRRGVVEVGLFKRYKFGSRVLRMGMRGPDVQALQEHLRERGYDIPTEEQHFSYLTREALQQFQRDYGLTVDGVAGKTVFALLKQERLPITRRIHSVAPGETIEQIAERYGVGVEAFSTSNRVRKLYPGQRLVFFDREVWAVAETPAQARSDLTGVFVPYDLNKIEQSEGIPGFHLENVVPALYTSAEDEVLWIHHQLCTPFRRRRLAEQAAALCRGAGGVCFCFTRLSRVDGGRYLALLKRVRRALLPQQRLMVQLGPGIPRRGFTSGLDFKALSRVVDRVVVHLPQPAEPGPVVDRRVVEKQLWPLLRVINPWQILLRLPVYALLWNLEDRTAPPVQLSHREAVTRIYRRSTRARQHTEQFYRFVEQGVEYGLGMASREAVSQVAALVNLYNLAGVALDRLGMEDGRLWQVLRSHFHTSHM